MFKAKFLLFVEKVHVLEDVIKVSLLPDPDKERQMNCNAVTRCSKCLTGLLEVKMGAKGPILGCNKCGKEVSVTMEADKLQRLPQRCPICDKYMVNVIKGNESKGARCVICEIRTTKIAADKEKAEKKRKDSTKSGEGEEEKADTSKSKSKSATAAKPAVEEEKKGKEEGKKKKKHKKKKALDIPVIVNPSA